MGILLRVPSETKLIFLHYSEACNSEFMMSLGGI